MYLKQVVPARPSEEFKFVYKVVSLVGLVCVVVITKDPPVRQEMGCFKFTV